MPKKSSSLIIIGFLGILLFLVLGNVKIAKAFEVPADCTPSGYQNNYYCTGTPPPASPECISITREVNQFSNCITQCNEVSGYALRYTLPPPPADHWAWYCCNGSGWAQCTILGEVITLGQGNPPPALTTSGWCDGCGLASPQVCMMCIIEWVASVPIRMVFFLPAIFLALLVLISGFFYSIAIAITNWLTGVSISIPITPSNPAMEPNFIVAQAWNFTRDFSQMFLILLLVFIGLATILKIKDYEAKKALPLLILIAILINFSPVIVGFIVDITNIFTNFFLTAAGKFNNLNDIGQRFVEYIKRTSDIWTSDGHFFERLFTVKTWGGITVGNYFAQFVGIIAYGIILTAFYVYGTIVFFFVGALFISRILFLWILMILAPIAFLSYIFPATRKLYMIGWNNWWGHLFQWAIIGIPIGFFLLLSNWIMNQTGVINRIFQSQNLSSNISGQQAATEATIGSMGGFVGGFADLLVSILAPLLAIVILWLGVKLAKKLAPEIALGIIEGIKKGFKFAAGTALVAATGGAAAGLLAKGMGGAARGAQRMEAFMGRVPGVGKALKFGVGKPISWTTRGMEKAAAPRLLEYQAKTRRVPEAELKKIEGMSGVEAENYINARTKMLPKGIAEKQRLQYMAHMANKDTLKYTNFAGPTGEAAQLANETLEKENPYFQKEADDILNSTGGITEKALVHSKLVGMPDKTKEDKEARKKKEEEIRREIKETGEIIEKRVGRDDFIIEVGLKLKYITKEEADIDKTVALAKVKAKAKDLEQDLRNESASATYVKNLKPEDIKKIIDPDTFATRAGITLGNPKNLQRIQDNFGRKKFESVIKGRGGLNDATDTSEKLDYFCSKINPQMGRAVFIRPSPAMNELALEGRGHMRDPNDQPATSPEAFERRIEIQKKLEKASPLLQNFNSLHIKAYQLEREIEDFKLKGKSTATKEERLASVLTDMTRQYERIERTTHLKTEWEKIEKLRTKGKQKRKP